MDLTWTDGTLVVVAVADADSDLRLRPAACRMLPTHALLPQPISSHLWMSRDVWSENTL